MTDLENLDILDAFLGPSFRIDCLPLIDNDFHFGRGQPSDSQIVARVKNDDVTCAFNWLCLKERVRCWRDGRPGRGEKRSKVIFKYLEATDVRFGMRGRFTERMASPSSSHTFRSAGHRSVCCQDKDSIRDHIREACWSGVVLSDPAMAVWSDGVRREHTRR